MGKTYTAEERAEPIKRAREIGNKAATERLVINVDTLYTWQSKARNQRNEILPQPTYEEVERENIYLKKALSEKEMEVEILQDALVFFIGNRKKSQNHKG